MTDNDQTVIFPLNGDSAPAVPVKSYDEFPAAEDRLPDFAAGLVSFAFIRAAIRRSARTWCVAAVVGFLLGVGVSVMSPPVYKASTSLLLTPGPYEEVNTAANNDQAMAESRAVAALAEQKLGLRQDAGSFLATYTAAAITERVMLFTISAPSSNQAVLRANAVATAFLQFRAAEMQAEQKLVLASLTQQASQAQQNLDSISAQISQLSAQPSSRAQQAQLQSLRTQHTQADTKAFNLQQAVLGEHTATEPATSAAVKGSVVLDAAVPLAHSRLKSLVLYAAIGLIAGLVLSMAIIVIRALVSDRLRRRDDVAHALGAPVKLSVGPVRLNRRLPGRGGRSAAHNADIQRIAEHLRHSVPGSSRGVAALAVVPVDDLQVAAASLVSLAESCAEQGKQVVVADLCSGAPAARLLGAGRPGVYAVDTDAARLVVAVPERDDVVPVGPIGRGPMHAQRSVFTEEVAAACASANLLLTLTTLDPALGSEHLVTWAANAVAVVTAGRSSWTRIHAVGEMTRLSGTRLVSAVLVGADSTDESIGMTHTPETVS